MKEKIIWHGERPIEFEYLYSDWNFFVKESFTLDEIANWDTQDYFPPILKDYVIIAKRQRTGLYDKNWTKIYTWDIVKTVHQIPFKTERKERLTIVSDVWYINYVLCDDSRNWYNPDEWIEVVGNIYQNADLLSE